MERTDHNSPDEKLGRMRKLFPIQRFGRDYTLPREIGFSIASNRGAGYDRHANRLPSKALTSGDSQAQPSSPHRKDSMPEPSALPWKVAAEKAAGELDTEKFRHHVPAAETAIFFRLQELRD